MVPCPAQWRGCTFFHDHGQDRLLIQEFNPAFIRGSGEPRQGSQVAAWLLVVIGVVVEDG